MRAAIFTTILVCGLAFPAQSQERDQVTAVSVGTVIAERVPTTQAAEFVGRVDAINRVEIRARVTGFLQSVEFKEGDRVKEGALLYRIEKDQFQAAVERARGALERTRAAKALAEIELERAEHLAKTGTGTIVVRDKARATNQEASGTLIVDQANLDAAKIDLGYTEILAPISGRIGRTNFTKGNVVGPDSGPLTVIVSQDPMYVTFPISQREFLRAEERAQKADIAGFKVSIRFSDGRAYKHQGLINFVDVKVDRSTDTVLARATFPNPDSFLVDGQLVRVNLETGSSEEKLAIPQAALIADQEGTYVFVVENGRAVAKRVKTGGERGADIIIEQGLAGGEQVIVEGLQNVRAGVPIQASPITQTLDRS